MITVQHDQFRKAALFAASVVKRRNTIPVLSTIKVTANGALTFEGTDLDSVARATCPYDGDEGELLLPEPGKLAAALKRAGGDTVTLTQGDKMVRLSAGELTSDLSMNMHPDDFPAASSVVAGESFGADVGEDFLCALHRVRPAISTEETRYYLNGVYIHHVGDWLYRINATDGHRLFMADVALPGATGELVEGVIIPRRTVERVVNAFAKSADGVRFAVGSGQNTNRKDSTLAPASGMSRAAFSGKVGDLDLSLSTKLIYGTYPDVSRVVPAVTEFTVRMEKAALVKALRSVMPLSSDKTRAIKLTLSPGMVTLTLQSPDIGTSQFPVPAQHQAPDGYEFGVNARYLLDAMNALLGDEVDFGLSDPAAPITITDPSDLAFRIVQMPMRV